MGKNQIKINEFQHKRRSIEKILDLKIASTSHQSRNITHLLSTVAPINPLIAQLVVSEQLNPIFPIFSISILIYIIIIR